MVEDMDIEDQAVICVPGQFSETSRRFGERISVSTERDSLIKVSAGDFLARLSELCQVWS